MSHEKRTHWKDIFQGSGLTFIVVFVMEMIEEGLENLIALGISTLFSTVLLVVFTQATKLGLKKLIKWTMPYVKTLIYREGDDKMKLLKKYWTLVWGNKITEIPGKYKFILKKILKKGYEFIFFNARKTQSEKSAHRERQ